MTCCAICITLRIIEPGENDKSDDDDEVGEFEKYVWVPGELKSGLGYPEQRSALDYQDTA